MTDTKYNINLHIIRVLGRFMKQLKAPLNTHIREHGLTPTQFIVLEILYTQGSQTVNEIIEKVFSTEGNIGLVVNNLMKQGLVEKNVDELDKRVRHVTLTDAGLDIIDTYFPIHVEALDALFSNASTQDKELLINVLKRVGKKL